MGRTTAYHFFAGNYGRKAVWRSHRRDPPRSRGRARSIKAPVWQSKKRSFGKYQSKKLLVLWRCFLFENAHVSLQVCKPLSREVIMKGFSWRVALAGAALLAASAAFPSVSRADTFTILTDNIGVTCSPSCGTVTVTDNGNNTYTFDVDLVPNTLVLHNTPGNPSAVAFNLAGVTALISSNSAGSTLSTSSPANGFGTFSFGVDCGT